MNLVDEKDEKPTRWEKCVEFIMFHFRWVFVVPFLLPLSFLFNTVFDFRNRIVHAVNSAPNAHVRKVKHIQEQLKEWNDNGRKSKLVNARPGWLTMSFRFPLYKENATKIATDKLFDILDLDVEKMTVKAEPGVTMGQLSQYLISRGYTLPVLPELDDLTVGGLINGCGVESGSFKYGMFQHICTGYEVVMSDGELKNVYPDSAAKTEQAKQDNSLFFAIPWSQGTICFLVAATIKIIPCKKYVKLTYKKTETLSEMCEQLTEDSDRNSENVDFVEALMFNKEKGCIMLGEFSDGPDTHDEVVNPIGRWYKKWFYTHVEDLINKKHESIEYIPLRDYYHRHSKSIFWELRDIVPFGNNVLFRYLMAWMCPPKIAFLKATTPNVLRKLYDRSHVLQDMLVPLDKLEECIDLFHKEVEIYPMWLCPFYLKSQPGLMKLRNATHKMYVDVGAYGVTSKDGYHHERTTRRLESFVRSVNGFQMTYADIYMTRAEYAEMFDRTLYDWKRASCKCIDAFPDIYDKICRSGRR
ncbi:Delta(24)-sterol reductase homolog dhcr-24 [Caenorhabditis elegans]|uniref:Delta(24)-sterol reductase homolog dhcr-24 n=1 Tax=Caenorhabditis elegans TaxID=6239 RepID=DHC24_CAEEL|nr:Diminuto-like protein [Caenorhabditis elegans]O17397.1 RecName: Full=Diminuto-like protein [Caenorhabditis elegans]CCD71661.1 Diminuto-like protein [Caenorhabditis elegans]|eukprot:NP_508463.1 Diminuto-like protein [Caenorhabditis elegans]